MAKVSVIIPTFNRANYICETIDSVLSQTYKDYEIIVVDDGSTDNTKEVISKYNEKIRYFYQENKGVSAARNYAISNAKGEYVAFLDDDDIWLQNKLEKQIDVLDKNPDLGFVCSDTYVIDGSGKIINLWKRGIHNHETFESLYEADFTFTLTVVARRRCLEEVGFFDETLSISQDYDLWLRLAKKYAFKHIGSPLAKYRLHAKNVSMDYDARFQQHRIIEKKPEIAKGISFLKRKIRTARDYYLFGSHHYSAHHFYRAGYYYLMAVLNFPFIGYYYYPKEIENFKFSLPYRIFKPYLIIFGCYLSKIKEISKRPIFRIVSFVLILYYVFMPILKKQLKNIHKKNIKLAIVDIEFFHKDAGGFGGYGKTAKNITDHFNSDINSGNIELILTRPSNSLGITKIHNTAVIVAPDLEDSNSANAFKYIKMLNRRNIDWLLTMEYCTDYQYSLFFLPKTPLVIWIHDPRPIEDLKKIGTVSLELKTSSINTLGELEKHEKHINDSMAKVVKLSKLFKRKLAFATTANCLIEKARKIYGMPDLEPIFLPTPVELPEIKDISYSNRPSVCFVGRLDPIKRPWIFFELAKKFEDIDFLVAGKTHFPKIMNPIISSCASIPNLKFLDFIDSQKKDELFRNAWALINTSVHEALPVSFLEAFAYGKPVISCQNPDNMVSRFGEYTGEILGDGLDNHTLDIFEKAVKKIIFERDLKRDKGIAAREFVEKNYSFKKFESALNEIIEKMIWRR